MIDTDDPEQLRWLREMRDCWAWQRSGLNHEKRPPPDINMRVYQIITGEVSGAKILPEIIAHRYALRLQSARMLRYWLRGRAIGARQQAIRQAEQWTRKAQEYEAMLAQLDGMNVVTAAPLKRIVSLIRADVDNKKRMPGDQPIA